MSKTVYEEKPLLTRYKIPENSSESVLFDVFQDYEKRLMVEAAGIEPASKSCDPENLHA